MFDPVEDVPVQDKHPDWIEWFKDNDLNIDQIAVDPLPVWNEDTSTLSVTCYVWDGDGLKILDPEFIPRREKITRKVKTPPPWERPSLTINSQVSFTEDRRGPDGGWGSSIS